MTTSDKHDSTVSASSSGLAGECSIDRPVPYDRRRSILRRSIDPKVQCQRSEHNAGLMHKRIALSVANAR